MDLMEFLKALKDTEGIGWSDDDVKRWIKELLDLRGENEKLKYILKCSIEVSDILEDTIRKMNKMGKKFGIEPLKITSRPVFIKKALKAQ